MPFGKNSRLDTRRPSSYSSTATIFVFVALCLVGVWMMTSSTVVPVDMSSSETNTEMKHQVPETDSKPFEDSNGDVPDESRTGNANTNSDTTSESSSESSLNQIVPKTTENTAETTQGENSGEPQDTSSSGTYSDVNGKLENGEAVKNGGEMDKDERNKKSDGDDANKGRQEANQDRNTEKNSGGITDTAQGKGPGQKSGQTENNEQERNSEQDSGQAENTERETNTEQNSSETGSNEQQQSDSDKDSEQKGKSDSDTVQNEKDQGKIEEMGEQTEGKEIEQTSDAKKTEGQETSQSSSEVFPDGAQSDLLNETSTQNGAWSTQAAESNNEKEVQASSSSKTDYNWKLCNVTAGADYIPCLDNEVAIKKLRTTKHYEHRERHCPDEAPTCLVPVPEGYKRSIEWPSSRDKIWYHNVPHTQLAAVKGHQNWVKLSGEYLTFPGGGTQFKHGALHYIDVIQEALSDIAWGKQSRVVLDVGCGVASFGGYLFDRDTLTMSFAPKDEHEAQVQFALERGIPAISAVMGTKRLPYPGRVFDVIHCARCRVPWHIEGGKLLLELNRLLRPGGHFVWSATPVYQKLPEDVEIWNAMSALTKSMCWEAVAKTKDAVDHVGLIVYRKPYNNSCYEKRKNNSPPICQESDDANAAWNIPLQACMHRLPEDSSVRGSKWPEQWPLRLEKTPYWLNSSQIGVYGKPAPKDFEVDMEHWNHVVSKSYRNGMGIDWSKVRNVMDMRAVYGGFAAALKDMKLWVMNIVPIDSPDTLPIIYERGLFGMYHDWCESFSSYPRTYDLLHADHLFSKLKTRCKLLPIIVEVDRLLRPEGKLIVRDNAEVISEVEAMAKSLHWEIRLTFSKQNEGLLCVQKTKWRPQEIEASTSPMS